MTSCPHGVAFRRPANVPAGRLTQDWSARISARYLVHVTVAKLVRRLLAPLLASNCSVARPAVPSAKMSKRELAALEALNVKRGDVVRTAFRGGVRQG